MVSTLLHCLSVYVVYNQKQNKFGLWLNQATSIRDHLLFCAQYESLDDMYMVTF